MSSIESIFESFGVTLSAEEQRRDELKKIVKEVDDVTRALNVSTQQLHENLSSALTSLNARVASALPTVRASFAKLSANIEPREFSKYKFMWQNNARDLTFVVTLLHWITKNELLSMTVVAQLLGMSEASKDAKLIPLEIEDYLMGVAMIPNELSRLAINCVTVGDFATPVRIAHFVQSLFSAFQLLNLKNDFLRKKYDSIKYDVNKIEQVLYDLKVRNLIATGALPATQVAGFDHVAAAAAAAAAANSTTTTTTTTAATN